MSWKEEGYTLELVSQDKFISVYAHDENGRLAGYAHFIKGPDFLEAREHESDSLFVKEEHRRKGLAQAMYDLAEEKSGMPLIPSEHLSGRGRLFWQARLKSLRKDHPAHDWF